MERIWVNIDVRKTSLDSDLILFSLTHTLTPSNTHTLKHTHTDTCTHAMHTNIHTESMWRLSWPSIVLLCFIPPAGYAPPFCPLFVWVELDSLSSILSVYLSPCCLVYGSTVKECVCALPSLCVCVFVSSRVGYPILLCVIMGGVFR